MERKYKVLTLDQLRKQIEEIDSLIIANLAKRKIISLQIGKLKKEMGKKIFDPQREKELRVYYAQLSQNYKIDPEYILDIFSLIINDSRLLQEQ